MYVQTTVQIFSFNLNPRVRKFLNNSLIHDQAYINQLSIQHIFFYSVPMTEKIRFYIFPGLISTRSLLK